MVSCANPALNHWRMGSTCCRCHLVRECVLVVLHPPCRSQAVPCTDSCSALQEALLALNEAVRVAQQNSDNGVLAESLAALCQLLAATTPQAAGRMGGPEGADVAARHHLQLLKLLRRQGRAASGWENSPAVPVRHQSQVAVPLFESEREGPCPSLACRRAYLHPGDVHIAICAPLVLAGGDYTPC